MALDMMIQPIARHREARWHTHLFYGHQEPFIECARLRFAYFVECRSWVEENPGKPGLEIDSFDPYAVHIAVSDERGISAYLRLLPFDPQIGFMLDGDLSCVVGEAIRQSLPRENSAEISRLVVSHDPERDVSSVDHAVELLFKEFYRDAKARGIKQVFIVVEPGWIRLFSRRFGLTFTVIGTPHVFQDGTRTVAAMATLEELEDGMRRFSPAKLAWYQGDEH